MKSIEMFSVYRALQRRICFGLLWCVALASSAPAVPAADQATSAEKQRALIQVLQSDAAPAEKAMTCKNLAIYGNQEAVPALAPLLANPDLSSWARIALEVIPGPEAEAALRDAMGRLEGRLLVGVLNSIGVRRDAKAVTALIAKMNAADPAVAGAAAAALGNIGGSEAAKALERALSAAPATVAEDIADACVVCADRFLLEGASADAMKLFDAVRSAKVPKHKILEGTRGAILARKSAGLPLLLEQLRSLDPAFFGIGLRTARELPGRDVTQALASETERCGVDRQPLMLAVLGDRGEVSVLPLMGRLAQAGTAEVRLAAVTAAERLGTAAAVPVLLDIAISADAVAARAAKTALVRLPGKDVEPDLVARLSSASGAVQTALLEVVGRRQVADALTFVMRSVQDPNEAVRRAALGTLGAIGQDRHLEDLARMLERVSSPQERADLEKALLAISRRQGSAALPHLLPLARSSQPSLRIVGLHALASVGGSSALATVKAALDDSDEGVQDEAVRTLATWSNNWPEDSAVAESLLTLAKSGKKESYRVLGLRGYFEHIQGNTKMQPEDKVARVRELQPLLTTMESKRMAISVLGGIPNQGALESLMAFVAMPEVAEDACSTIVAMATGREAKRLPADARRKALQLVAEKSKNEAPRQKAEAALKNL